MRNVIFQPKPSKAKNRGWRRKPSLAWSPRPALVRASTQRGWLFSRAQGGAQRRLEVSLLAKSGRAEPAPGRRAHTEEGLGQAAAHLGTPWEREAGPRETEFPLASWAFPLGPAAQAPFVEGPAPAQNEVGEQ